MSDEEEESMSEGFSASEDEWKPTRDARGGESSDDDDSDFESPAATASGGGKSSSTTASSKKRDQKPPSGIKGASVKKRKPMQSLRAKLYNKYRPPPKTFPTSPTSSPKASGSGSNRTTASKNATTPNESGDHQRNVDNESSSESSVEDYLVNPNDLDLHSSFFTSGGAANAEYKKEKSPAPTFDCNAGMTNLSDSGSEDDNESSIEDNTKSKAFDFRNLLENANSLERAKEDMAKRAAESVKQTGTAEAAALDVNALLALGENQNYATNSDGQTIEDAPSKLSKTKSTRVKRHTKTRPASTVVAGGDSDDSDWEEVAGKLQNSNASDGDDSPQDGNLSHDGNLEIHVDLPTKHQRTKQQKTQDELELAFKRRLNHDMKVRQLSLHKTNLLCLIARSYKYNRIANHSILMQATLKLLPNNNVYPTERGTELKYFQSFVTWFKTAIKLKTPDMYPPKSAGKRKVDIILELHALIKRKEARCKQDMVLIFVALARAMGMHCRLVVNMQPMPLRPAASDLIPIKLSREETQTTKAEIKQETKKELNNSLTTKSIVIKSEKTKKSDSSSAKSKVTCSENKANVPKKTISSSKKTVKSKEREKDEKTEKNTSKSSPSKGIKIKEKVSSDVNQEKPTRTRSRRIAKDEAEDEDISMEPSTSSSRNTMKSNTKPALSKLKRSPNLGPKHVESKDSESIHNLKKAKLDTPKSLLVQTAPGTPIARRTRKASTEVRKLDVPQIKIGSPVVPRIVLKAGKDVTATRIKTENENAKPSSLRARDSRSRSKSPKMQISPNFLITKNLKEKFPEPKPEPKKQSSKRIQDAKMRISPTFLKSKTVAGNVDGNAPGRVLRTRQQRTAVSTVTNSRDSPNSLKIPQLDGGVDEDGLPSTSKKRLKLEKLNKTRSKEESDEEFEPSPPKRTKKAPLLPKAVKTLRQDRRVLSTDDETMGGIAAKSKRKDTAADWWIELWSDIEEKWICTDLFMGKLNSVESIRKSASDSLAYVFAFQNDLTLKDVTARYCPKWATTVRKARVEKSWLDSAIAPYLAKRTKRDIHEDLELRLIHEELPMPTTISEYKDHPLYALERHLLKFQAIYPPNPPTMGFIRGEPVYSRDCVHTLHSREIWVKSARVVKPGEQPYKIVKARPKWDRLTQSVIKDQPLEIFGHWQTQDYEPPTAENGIVPRNAYGNVELFKECMLPKKTVLIKLPGLNRICKKLNIDCANAVIGFDFHQGACHPVFDGFVVCEEFQDQVTAAWYQDQEEQERKEQEKYEARVYGNWKKLIKGLIVRERLKKKYNF